MEDNQGVAELQSRLVAEIGADRFELWFGRHVQLRLAEGMLCVVTASNFARDCLRRNVGAALRVVCRALWGEAARVEFEVDVSLAEAMAATKQPVEAAPPEPPAAQASSPRSVAVTQVNGTMPHARLSGSPRREPALAGLVIGISNEYAVRAADVTARGLQQASPVTFCGSTGTGKTHILRAIRCEYRQTHPRAHAVYLTAEQFTTSFVEALRGTGLPSFRQKCRGADLLAIDDLQFFVGKRTRASLDELLHTLDALVNEGRQVVLAADRKLAELQPLGKELVSRLSSGLVCNLTPPDFSMRLGIVRQLARELDVALGPGVAEVVATQISAGARELRGALYRLEAASFASGESITQPMALAILADLVQQCTLNVRLADVEQAVCRVFGVEAVALRSERKSRSIHEPRMLAMWLARKYTRAPWSEIGEFFGRRSHSTVISAHRQVEKLIRVQGQIGVSHETCRVEEAIRRVELALRTA